MLFPLFLSRKRVKEKKRYIFEKKNPKKNQNSVTIMISVDGKGTVFPAKLKLEEKLFE